MPKDDYKNFKKLEVTSQNDSGTTQDKAQPILLVDGDDSTTGTGDIVIDFANIAGPEDIAVYDQNGNLLNYEIEELDTTNNTAVLWVYNSWTRDDTVQAQIAYGDNSANTDRQNIESTWPSDAMAVYHLDEESGQTIDSTSNNNDSTNTTGTTFNKDTIFNGGRGFDNTDDNIQLPDNSQDDATNELAVVAWINPNDNSDGSSDQDRVLDYTGGSKRKYALWWNRDGAFTGGGGNSFTVFDANDNNYFANTTTTQSPGNNYLLGGEYDGADLKLVRDGSFVDKNNIGFKNLQDATTPNIGSNAGGSEYVNSDISEARMYSSSKGSEWWQAEYDASPKAGQVYFSQQAAETTLTFKGATTTSTATATGVTTNLSGSTTTQTTTAIATGRGGTIFIEPDFSTLSATGISTGGTVSISGATTLDPSTASATGKGGTTNLSRFLAATTATATGTGSTTKPDRLKGTVDVEDQPTSGVDVNVVDKTNNILYETVTDSNGDWIVDSGDGIVYQVAYLFDDGTTYYGDAEESDTT